MRSIGLIILNIFIGQLSFSQSLFNKDSEINLLFDKQNQAYFKHTIYSSEAIVPLAKLVDFKPIEILAYNKLEKGQPFKNKELNIPINLAQIIRKEKTLQREVCIPIYYTVKKGDTVYKIAKTFGQENVDDFKSRNKLTDNNLTPSSKLLMGWIKISNNNPTKLNASDEKSNKLGNQEQTMKPKTKIETKGKQSIEIIEIGKKPTSKASIVVDEKNKKIDAHLPKINKIISSKNTKEEVDITKAKFEKIVESKVDVQKDSIAEAIKMGWVNKRGIAYWQQSHRKSKGKYVLHSTAPINSIVKIYNPMMKKSIDAKVVGRIPIETYRKDVDIVISPAIAESLGALDSRFMVEVTYKR